MTGSGIGHSPVSTATGAGLAPERPLLDAVFAAQSVTPDAGAERPALTLLGGAGIVCDDESCAVPAATGPSAP